MVFYFGVNPVIVLACIWFGMLPLLMIKQKSPLCYRADPVAIYHSTLSCWHGSLQWHLLVLVSPYRLKLELYFPHPQVSEGPRDFTLWECSVKCKVVWMSGSRENWEPSPCGTGRRYSLFLSHIKTQTYSILSISTGAGVGHSRPGALS